MNCRVYSRCRASDSPETVFLSPSTQWLATISQRPSFTRRAISASMSGLYWRINSSTLAWLCAKVKSGNSSISLSIVRNVSLVVCTVSGQDHIQFISMCAWPMQWIV